MDLQIGDERTGSVYKIERSTDVTRRSPGGHCGRGDPSPPLSGEMHLNSSSEWLCSLRTSLDTTGGNYLRCGTHYRPPWKAAGGGACGNAHIIWAGSSTDGEIPVWPSTEKHENVMSATERSIARFHGAPTNTG